MRSIRKKLNLVIIICFLIMTFLVNVSLVFAQAGTGSGSQSSSPGVPGQKPLNYLGTFLPDGTKVDNSTSIPINPKFTVEFDKNVVNSLIWTNNSQCFAMKSGNTTIPIKVTKIDDTVDFSQRQNIFVQPAAPLQTGTSYQMIISPKLMAKNEASTLSGTTNGQGVSVTFRTQGAAPSTTPTTPAKTTPTPATSSTTPSTKIPVTSPATSTTPNSAAAQTPTGSPTTQANPSAPSTQNQNDTTLNPNGLTTPQTQSPPPSSVAQNAAAKKPSGISTTTWLSIIGAVLVVGWIAVELYMRNKKMK